MASAMEDRTAAKPAAVEYGAAGSQTATMKHRTAAVERCGPAMKAASAMETTATVETAAAVKAAASTTVETAAATTMSTTADFGCQSAGSGFRRRCRARIDQRQRLRPLWNG